MIILNHREIETLIDLPRMAVAVEKAYRLASAGKVKLPPVGHIAFPDLEADCHIKYGHLEGDDNFVIKVATGFPQNSRCHQPTGNGLVLVLSALSGEVCAFLHDEMLLTDVRTGLGGAIVSRLLARRNSRNLLLLGTGSQVRWQIEAHKVLMPQLTHYELWGRNIERADQAIRNISNICDVAHATDLKQAVQKADVILTVTGSTEPLIRSDWVKDGTHITAVGADAPGKQELDVDLVARAESLVVDLISQCVDHGDVSHAVGSKRIDQSRLVEVGKALENPTLGRVDDKQVTIADLTGIAAQDIAISNAVLKLLSS